MICWQLLITRKEECKLQENILLFILDRWNSNTLIFDNFDENNHALNTQIWWFSIHPVLISQLILDSSRIANFCVEKFKVIIIKVLQNVSAMSSLLPILSKLLKTFKKRNLQLFCSFTSIITEQNTNSITSCSLPLRNFMCELLE